jgi:hypothetical protein
MLGPTCATENTNYFRLLVTSEDEVKMSHALKNVSGLRALLSV